MCFSQDLDLNSRKEMNGSLQLAAQAVCSKPQNISLGYCIVAQILGM